MVLDGALDPSLPAAELSVEQAQGFEGVLDSFFRWCAASSGCSWRPSGTPLGTLLALARSLTTDPLPAGAGQTLSASDLYTGVLETLYSTSSWPTLGRALAQAGAGNGAALKALSQSYETHGGTNSADAQMAINCADHPTVTDPAAYPALAAAAGARAPFFGPLLAWGGLGCAVWDAPAQWEAHPVSDPGAPPVLVTGTSGDPATPYSWAVSLSAQLHGRLLTRVGQDHVAYYYSACVRNIDQAYLVGLVLPAVGTVCT
jgi:hypothetical protein